MISDSQTVLEWIVGLDEDMTYAQAVQWVAGCNVAGGGWCMPTREQLKTLYQEGVGKRNMDPSFKTTGLLVWAEPRDSTAWDLSSGRSTSGILFPGIFAGTRAFGVRSRPR